VIRPASVYDLKYRFIDQDRHLAAVMAMIERMRPDARTVLDVACGTGVQADRLASRYAVEALDLDADAIAIARERRPDLPFHVADMRTFDLGRRFDVVTCLFASIVYVRTPEALAATVARMAAHLAPGGLVLIDGWLRPDQFWLDHLVLNTAEEPGRRLAWGYVQRREDDVAILDIHHLLVSADGVDTWNDRHEMGLFRTEDYTHAFQAAGLTPGHDPVGFFGKGLHWGEAPRDAR
jgi:SAM-dependent methyltransferase